MFDSFQQALIKTKNRHRNDEASAVLEKDALQENVLGAEVTSSIRLDPLYGLYAHRVRIAAAPRDTHLNIMLSLCLASWLLLVSPFLGCSAIPLAQQPFLLGSSFGIPTVNRSFDYVIVGGGNAGLTLASRLSQKPGTSVAVVEAGSFYELTNGNISQIPAYEASHWNGKNPADSNPLVDWEFVTTPQAVCD